MNRMAKIFTEQNFGEFCKLDDIPEIYLAKFSIA